MSKLYLHTHHRHPVNKDVVKTLRQALAAAEEGKVVSVALSYISNEGVIKKASAGGRQYDTALIGALTCLSMDLNK